MAEISFDAGEGLVLEVVALLLENKQDTAKRIVNDDTQKNMLKAGSWDLVSKICELITDENVNKDGFVETCEHILLRLCETCNAKELLLVLLEQADRFKDDTRFTTLLAPLQECLLALPSRRGHSVALVLDTLYAHILTLPKTQEQLLEGGERKLLDSDDTVWRISKVLTSFLEFLEPFVKEATWQNKDESVAKQRQELTKCLIKIFNYPLAYMDLTTNDSATKAVSRPRGRILAESVMRQLSILQGNFAQYLFSARAGIEEYKMKQEAESANSEQRNKVHEENDDDLEEDDDEEFVCELGTSVFAYFVFSEQLHQDNVPQIMAHQYWLELNLPFITCLLEQQSWLVQEKGVDLLGSIVGRIKSASLPADFFGTYRIKLLLKGMLKVLCTGQSKQVAQSALKHFTTLLWCFESLGRYNLILFVLKKSQHSGVIGYCITQLKELINENLGMEKPGETFRGAQLAQLLKVVFTLPDCEKTDLMENSNQIMSALNLLRYLILRDKPCQNVTTIWSLLPQIQKTFCDNLRIGINMSRAHFQMDMDRTKKGKKMADALEMEFSVGSEAVPGLNKQQKLQMLSVALHTFDMMESVLGRISELITQAQK